MDDRGTTGRTRNGAAAGRHRAQDTVDTRSDALLTAEIRDGGDAGATAELYRRHAPAVLLYARSCCRDPHTAEDLASEAFARTVRAVRDGKGPAEAWRPYLLAVVRHTAADWADQARRVDLTPGFGTWADSAAARRRGGEPVSGETGGEEHVLRAEDGGLVAAAFRALPERWRAVLWHSVVEEEPAAKVGTQLGLTPSGVASLTARAREGLREAYLAAHAVQGAADEECRRCGDRLAAAVRRTRPRRDPLLDRHLERCGRCRRAAHDLTDLNQRLRTVLPVAVLLFGGPAYLEARAAATVAEASGQATAGGGVAGAKAGLLAVGAVAVLLGGWALRPGGEEPLQERPSPAASATAALVAPRAQLSPPASPSASSSTSPSASPSRTASTPAAPEPGAPALGAPGTLRFVSTGGCLEIAAGPGARPVEAACGGGAGQRWVLLEPYEGDRARTQVRNEASGLCLTRSGSTEDHAPVDQRACDPARETQLWNLWADAAKGEAALRDADGTRYLGLVEWARADKDQAHGASVGTTRYYYGSASMRFRFEPAMLSGQ
ncbi:sigma-70 family RNA polymerase sigma factor [Streptomyces sp. For3]|uniref:sigma-70 family RNA polymerase sigma factor n=1 Tax=Streptomyces silvae TaxID=2803812 RepID=UPI00192176A9|nr:sigma-70 family RNA polymerase sigma factor [Streptomyces silvae]MBL1288594.1 sigma-70 family RNA polymerase sigma factor [Streptomyces silvae]